MIISFVGFYVIVAVAFLLFFFIYDDISFHLKDISFSTFILMSLLWPFTLINILMCFPSWYKQLLDNYSKLRKSLTKNKK